MSEDTEVVLDQDSNDQQEPVVEAEETQMEPQQEVKETPKEEATEPKPEPRKVWTMPVEKAQEEKRRAAEKARAEAEAEAQAKIEQLKAEYEAKLASASSATPFDQELEQVASEYNLDPKAAKALVGVIEKKVKGSVPDLSKYDQILKEREIESAKMAVSSEFDEKVAPLILKDYPQATPEHLREVKERIAELAFSEGYNTYRVEDLYKIKRDEFEFKNGYSAESSGGRSSELVDFSKMTDEQEIELSRRDPETFKKFVRWQVANESKYLD